MLTRRTGAVLKALSSVVLLLAILIAVPWALIAFGGNPLPDHIPSWSEVTAFLSGGTLTTAFVGLLVIIAWLAWAYLLIAIVLAIPAELAGRPALQLPGGDWAGRLAGALVAAVLAGMAGTLSSAAPPALATPTAPTAPGPAPYEQDSAEHDQDAGMDGSVSEPATGDLVITVTAGDTLWDLAEHYYGDGLQYPVIAQANLHTAQPDGLSLATASSDATAIEPGWKLRIPGIAAPDPATTQIHTVRRGDTLSEIARSHYGTTDALEMIVHTNLGSVQPDGRALTDPDQIDVGWQLVLPASAPPADAAPSSPPPPPAEAPPTPQTETETGPGVSGTDSPPPTDPTATGASRAGESPATGTTHAAEEDSDQAIVRSTVAIGFLLAASYLGLLGKKRLVQRRRRRPGEQTAVAVTISDLELAMRQVDEPASIEMLDRALRSLARSAAHAGQSLPPLTAAIVGRGGLKVLPATTSVPLPPFAAADGGWWHLDVTSPELLDAGAAEDYATPFPTLTTLGTAHDGSLYLVDLESAGIVMMRGSASVLRGVLAATTLELASAPWAEDLTVHTVGFGDDLAGAVAGDRIRSSACLNDVLTELESRQQIALAALDEDGAGDPRDARVTDAAPDVWSPEILLTAEAITDEQQTRLARIAADTRSPLAAVVVGAAAKADLPSPWQLDVDENGQAFLPPLQVTVQLQRLSAEQLRAVIDDLSTADDLKSVPCPERTGVPAEPTAPLPIIDLTDVPSVPGGAEPEQTKDADTAEDADVDVIGAEIRVLGPVEIAGASGPVDSNKKATLLELAVYLAMNPGVSGDHISDILGANGRPWTASTRNGNISRLRKWLGRDPRGNDYVPPMSATAGYRLADQLRTDWSRFTRLTSKGIAQCRAGNPTDLERALRLVRGEPFQNRPRRRYNWAEHEMTSMRDGILDVVHTLATHYTETARIEDARRVLEKGLLIEPASELLYRDLIRAEARIGNHAAINSAVERVDRINADLGMDREPETDRLLDELGDRTIRAAHG